MLKKTTPYYPPDISTTSPTLLSNVNISQNLHTTPVNITGNTSSNRNRKLACLDVFEVGIHWRDAVFKFDGLWKGFSHLTDFSLNQVKNKIICFHYAIIL